jgi:hypothetical protein
MDDFGRQVKAVTPSSAAEIIGLKEPPEAGDDLLAVDSAFRARKIADRRQAGRMAQ